MSELSSLRGSERYGACDDAFPHTVTLYNTRSVLDRADYQETTICSVTVLRGVLLDATGAVNVTAGNRSGDGASRLYVPCGAEAADGVTGEPREYADPAAWARMEDVSGVWTADTSGGTFFIKGEVVEPGKSFQELHREYDGVYAVTRVDKRDFGGLKHFMIGGDSIWKRRA